MKRAYPYRNLERETFNSILEMLSEGIAAKRGRYGAYVHRDRVNGKLRARRGARLAAITSGGAIPDNSLYAVVAEPEGIVVGTVDEDFAVESMAGEVMLLGNSSWRIRRIETKAGRMLVEDAQARRQGFRSGGERLRRGPRNCRRMWANCGKKSASGCCGLLRWDFRRRNRRSLR